MKTLKLAFITLAAQAFLGGPTEAQPILIPAIAAALTSLHVLPIMLGPLAGLAHLKKKKTQDAAPPTRSTEGPPQSVVDLRVAELAMVYLNWERMDKWMEVIEGETKGSLNASQVFDTALQLLEDEVDYQFKYVGGGTGLFQPARAPDQREDGITEEFTRANLKRAMAVRIEELAEAFGAKYEANLKEPNVPLRAAKKNGIIEG